LRLTAAVSVLFSEPKIPQFRVRSRPLQRAGGFSALQRAENSSIVMLRGTGVGQPRVSVLFSEPKIPQFVPAARHKPRADVSVLFSEPKIPQCLVNTQRDGVPRRFSALQRAENSSIELSGHQKPAARAFQCSSASRKFLNAGRTSGVFAVCRSFSALQRAENSSIQRSEYLRRLRR